MQQTYEEAQSGLLPSGTEKNVIKNGPEIQYHFNSISYIWWRD
jgi:hypothetical protein